VVKRVQARGGFTAIVITIAWSCFNSHPRRVVTSLDKTFYNNYLCLVASKKQQINREKVQWSYSKNKLN